MADPETERKYQVPIIREKRAKETGGHERLRERCIHVSQGLHHFEDIFFIPRHQRKRRGNNNLNIVALLGKWRIG